MKLKDKLKTITIPLLRKTISNLSDWFLVIAFISSIIAIILIVIDFLFFGRPFLRVGILAEATRYASSYGLITQIFLYLANFTLLGFLLLFVMLFIIIGIPRFETISFFLMLLRIFLIIELYYIPIAPSIIELVTSLPKLNPLIYYILLVSALLSVILFPIYLEKLKRIKLLISETEFNSRIIYVSYFIAIIFHFLFLLYSIGLPILYIFFTQGLDGTTVVITTVFSWILLVLVFSNLYFFADKCIYRNSEFRILSITRKKFVFPEKAEIRSWQPKYFDYFYLALTIGTSFGPADVSPISRYTKTLVMIQSLLSLIFIGLAIARGVNIMVNDPQTNAIEDQIKFVISIANKLS